MLLLLTIPQRMPQGSCHRCHLLPGSRRQGCTVGGFRNIAMATIVEMAKSLLSLIVGVSSLTFLQQADPWAQKAPKFLSGAKGCQSVNFLVCSVCQKLVCVHPTVANLQLSSMTSPVRKKVDLTKFQRKPLRMATPTMKSGGLTRWSWMQWKEKGQCSK